MSYKTEAAKKRDQRIADDAGTDPALMCAARGCPRQWSVHGDLGRCCAAHYGADPRDWPSITEQVQREETDRAMRNSSRNSAATARAPTREERQAILSKLGSLGRQGQEGQPDGRAWARRLHERHQRGEHLTPGQVAAYRAALPYAELNPSEGEP